MTTISISDALATYRTAKTVLEEAVRVAVPVGTAVTHPKFGPCVVVSELTDADCVAVQCRGESVRAVPVVVMLGLMATAANAKQSVRREGLRRFA
jgi:hypothetical protein